MALFMKVKKRIMLIVPGIIFTVIIITIASSCRSFGKLPSGERLERIENSPYYTDGSFHYPGPLPVRPEPSAEEKSKKRYGGMFGVLKRILFGGDKREKPSLPLPSSKTDLFALDRNDNLIVWMGHSSYYMQVDGKRFLVDPVFSGKALVVKAFKGSDIYEPADIPPLDFLVISHDHWDHLDYKTVTALQDQSAKVITGLGTASHLEYWGFKKENIIELEWNETADLGGGFSTTAIATPHFSGRALTRNKTQWSAFVLKTPSRNIYIGGDGGYADFFTDVGSRYGPFDLAFLECGQYNEQWRNSHMFPEDTAQASIDLKAKKLFAVHYAKFVLSTHAWDEPITRLRAICDERNITLIHPLIGARVNFDKDEIYPRWWEGIDQP
ncbi:MAG: MBL fold metallo-hydrolase [Spirochaetaceae bacterium]|jgi:L-ascorbate metabolism protein UlaG (beta-lactamase superfamily)|nr:MBL fold metallo-hydrolase [Spirochaetaceae bacterium]